MVTGIGFFLKGNIKISPVMISIPDEVDQVIEQIQDIKRNNQQFDLLAQVYLFMVNQGPIMFLMFMLDKDKRI